MDVNKSSFIAEYINTGEASASKKNSLPKKLGSQNIFGSKRCCVKKIREKCFAPKRFWVQTFYGSIKNFSSKKFPALTCLDLTECDLICPDSTCPDSTCPDSTCPDSTCPDLTCPDSNCPDSTCPDSSL